MWARLVLALSQGAADHCSKGSDQRLPAELVTSASIARQWAPVSEQLDGTLYEQLADTDEFSWVEDFGKFWKAEQKNLAQVQLNLLPCIREPSVSYAHGRELVQHIVKRMPGYVAKAPAMPTISIFCNTTTLSESETERKSRPDLAYCGFEKEGWRDHPALPITHAGLQHIWKAKRLPLCVERGTAHPSASLPVDTSSDGFKELGFLLWLGEALKLKAEAEHQDLWLMPGQQVHAKSSQGRQLASFQIKAVLQQRTCFSATYSARCSVTGLAVVVKLGPLPEHRSQAKLLQLNRGAWDQVSNELAMWQAPGTPVLRGLVSADAQGSVASVDDQATHGLIGSPIIVTSPLGVALSSMPRPIAMLQDPSSLVADVSEGLHCLQRHGVSHNDVRPCNMGFSNSRVGSFYCFDLGYACSWNALRAAVCLPAHGLYSSLDILQDRRPAPFSDMQALLFSAMDLSGCTLPWAEVAKVWGHPGAVRLRRKLMQDALGSSVLNSWPQHLQLFASRVFKASLLPVEQQQQMVNDSPSSSIAPSLPKLA
ncbi:hypothetical protein WJX74_007206 [Apatococcus lobatus]|uniref:Protein kinase domain-containing protein n=1 Tax=Apatococcus lobatus TaxID=904363 RepID=A0AAW1QCQ8_9CHLO